MKMAHLPATRCGGAQPKWLRTPTRRYRPEYRSPKLNKLGGKVTEERNEHDHREKSSNPVRRAKFS